MGTKKFVQIIVQSVGGEMIMFWIKLKLIELEVQKVRLSDEETSKRKA